MMTSQFKRCSACGASLKMAVLRWCRRLTSWYNDDSHGRWSHCCWSCHRDISPYFAYHPKNWSLVGAFQMCLYRLNNFGCFESRQFGSILCILVGFPPVWQPASAFFHDPHLSELFRTHLANCRSGNRKWSQQSKRNFGMQYLIFERFLPQKYSNSGALNCCSCDFYIFLSLAAMVSAPGTQTIGPAIGNANMSNAPQTVPPPLGFFMLGCWGTRVIRTWSSDNRH